MSVQSNIIIQSSDDMSQVKVDTLSPKESIESLVTYLNKLAIGCGSGSVDMRMSRTGGAAASGTVTLSAMVATDTITVGNQTFTCVASGATGNQFNVGGTDTLTAAAAAAAINACAALSGVCTAAAALGVITVTAAEYTAMGNMIQLAVSAHGTASGAKLTGGVNPTSNVMHCGL